MSAHTAESDAPKHVALTLTVPATWPDQTWYDALDVLTAAGYRVESVLFADAPIPPGVTEQTSATGE